MSVFLLALIPSLFFGTAFRYYTISQDIKELLEKNRVYVSNDDLITLTHPSLLQNLGGKLFIGVPVLILIIAYHKDFTTALIALFGIIVCTIAMGVFFPPKNYVLKKMRENLLIRKRELPIQLRNRLTDSDISHLLATISVMHITSNKTGNTTSTTTNDNMNGVLERFKEFKNEVDAGRNPNEVFSDIYREKEVKHKQNKPKILPGAPITCEFSEDEIDILGKKFAKLAHLFTRHEELGSCGIVHDTEYHLLLCELIKFRLSCIDYILNKRISSKMYFLLIKQSTTKHFYSEIDRIQKIIFPNDPKQTDDNQPYESQRLYYLSFLEEEETQKACSMIAYFMIEHIKLCLPNIKPKLSPHQSQQIKNSLKNILFQELSEVRGQVELILVGV
ncbi:hypothetical protein SOV_17020 [Sporomusa ovata DSM 2662]|uniref:Uncharacterized protein n=1 Tax=Sporomusa ovata TaxID=2378 RepID=A0A0U1KWQ1_9FIRM|nr:hypothetical protein [Sporomusa ovata]EQB29302.1 hypothetical protein SOV_1c10350 [Sporomusa ovata DSM 2662]CQR71343.1 hypothetical protein SpAn4DRAFT_3848 [Sporomusa ovata]